MRVLVICEKSGRVRDAFKARGHYAVSCDLMPSETDGLHYRGDIHKSGLLTECWDLVIAFPPCTYLSNVQAIHYNDTKFPDKTRRRKIKREAAIEFFKSIKRIPCRKIAIENPLPSRYVQSKVGKYDQIVQPWMFGDPFSKKICLWLLGLPELKPTCIVYKGDFNKGTGKRTNAKWYHNLPPSKDRASIRSKTFPGIAKAMAEQWG